jgi:hypothetical protein
MDKAWIIQTITMLGIGALGFFIKDLKKSIEGRIEQNTKGIDNNTEKIETLEEKFSNYKETVAMRYVQKDEFIRAVTSMDKKLDKIYDRVVEKGE